MTKEEREIALYCLKVSSDYHSELCEECVKYPNCDHTIQDDVTETIIKALEQTMWIPVSERLPEVGQRVLATDKFEAVTTAIYFKKSPFWREMIVAWMPLPQPYKEKQDVCKDCYYNDGEVHAECVICDKAESEDKG